MIKVGEVTFEEPDSLYIGRPRALTIAPDGTFFVADGFSERVVRFDAGGDLAQVYGERGEGPGQLEGIGTVALFDTLLIVEDWGEMRLEMFDRRTGSHIGGRDYEGKIGGVANIGSQLLIGNLSTFRNSSLIRWEPPGKHLSYYLPVPEVYLRSEPLTGIYNGVFVAPLGDSVLVGYSGTSDIHILNRQLDQTGTTRIPAVRRRKQPERMIEKLEELPFPEKFSLLSALFDMSRLPSGEVALVHFDQTLQPGRQVEVEVYLSLLSPDLREACVDRLVPIASVSQPRTDFRGDTLFVLQQEIHDADHEVRTFVEKFAIDGRNCRWLPLPDG